MGSAPLFIFREGNVALDGNERIAPQHIAEAIQYARTFLTD